MSERSIQDLIGPSGFFEKRGETGVLLIHGLTGTPSEMRHFGRQLARKGLTVACPQLAGHCDSVSALKASTWEDWYRSVDEAFEALTRECQQVHVAGLSMGALLGLLLAARKKERLAGVTLLSPTFFYDGWNIPKWRQRLLLPLVIYTPLRHFISWEEPPPYGIKDERVRAMVSAVLENRDSKTADKIGHFKTPASVIRESKRLIRAATQCLAGVRRPALVVHSTEDDMASIKNAHFVTNRIGSHRVETFFVDDSYHVLTLDKRKDDIAARVAAFCAVNPA
jgi:carboxylesterase